MKMLSKDEFNSFFPKSIITDRIKSNQNVKVLLLGAGFSSRFIDDLTNKRILETMLNKVSENVEYGQLTSLLNTKSSIEKILNDLFVTFQTFKILFQDEIRFLDRIHKTYSNIRHLFIESIIENVVHDPVKIHKNNIADFLLSFDYIFTVSYDPILYWSFMMKQDDKTYAIDHPDIPNLRCPIYGDYFIKGEFKPDVDAFNNTNTPKTLFHYLHGSMLIYETKDLYYGENGLIYKISKADGTDLCAKIRDQYLNSEIENNINKLPIVVSECNSELKLDQIYSNNYLRDIYYKFKNILERKNIDLCVLGYEGNCEDEHINKVIYDSDPSRIVFCSFNGKSRIEKEFIKRKFDGNNIFEYDISDKYSHPLICDQAFRKENAEE